MKQIAKLTCCLYLVLAIGACTAERRNLPNFDGDRAFKLLTKQVSFGPRVPGSPASLNCRDFFYRYFDSIGVAVDSQLTSFLDPYSRKSIPLVNVMASIEGSSPDEDGILLMAHYDSRPRTDFPSNPALRDQPIAGANDGASGVAVLMELAALAAAVQPPRNIEFVFVDGEDWGRAGDLDFYMLGSREYARIVEADKYCFGIVLDMVGDKDLQFYREGYSERFAKPVVDMVWKTASELGYGQFKDSIKYTIQDDHLSLNVAGVSTIDIIDFDYPYWHTENDTPDKCSPRSLEAVGDVMIHVIYNPSRWPPK